MDEVSRVTETEGPAAPLAFTDYTFECLTCGRDTRVTVDTLEMFRKMERGAAAREGAPVPNDWPSDEYLVAMLENCVECATGTELPGEHDIRFQHTDIREARGAYREAQEAFRKAQDTLRERKALYVMTLGNHVTEAHNIGLGGDPFDLVRLNGTHGDAHKADAGKEGRA